MAGNQKTENRKRETMTFPFLRLKRYKNELFAGALFFLASISSLWVFELNRALEKQWQIRREKEVELQKLVDLSIQYPDYRDLLSRLGVAQWELGNDQAAKDALNRAKYLDPNNPAGSRVNAALKIPTP